MSIVSKLANCPEKDKTDYLCNYVMFGDTDSFVGKLHASLKVARLARHVAFNR